MAAADGNQYEYDSHLEGGWTWEKHAQSEETLNKISSQKWDVVVLQEYSTRLAYNQVNLGSMLKYQESNQTLSLRINVEISTTKNQTLNHF